MLKRKFNWKQLDQSRIDNAAFVLLILYFTSSFLSAGYRFATPMLAVYAVLVACCAVLSCRGIPRVRVEALHILTILFMLFCGLSALWADNVSMVFVRTGTIMKILMTTFLLYIYCQKQPVDRLLKAVMFGGYAVCVIVFLNYGGAIFKALMKGSRIDIHEFINANTLGLLCAYTLIISFFYIFYDHKFRWWMLLTITTFVCFIVCSSKTSYVAIAGGVLMLIVLRKFNKKNWLRASIIMIAGILILAAVLYLLRDIPVFSQIVLRWERFIHFFTGNGETDNSTNERVAMIGVGIRLFKKAPILGVGIDNPALYNIRQTYLHNNFLELLAGVGIIGFVLYYAIYAHLFWCMWKYRAYRDKVYDICLTLLAVHFVIDMSYVSYYSKDMYFYFMLFYVEVNRLKSVANNPQIEVTASIGSES